MTAHPWRYRCPEGHAAVELYRSTFRCTTCGQSYSKDRLVDLHDPVHRARRDGR